MLETLGEDILAICFKDHRIHNIKITLKKLEVFSEADSVGIEIYRNKFLLKLSLITFVINSETLCESLFLKLNQHECFNKISLISFPNLSLRYKPRKRDDVKLQNKILRKILIYCLVY